MSARWTGPVVATIDMLLALFIVAAALIVEPSTKASDATDKAICNMAIDLAWDAKGQADVDLWVKGPSGGPVGWKSKSNDYMSLVKDDMGYSNDVSVNNSERICVKEVLDGEYVINADMFNTHGDTLPLRVTGQVAVVNPSTAFMDKLGEWDTSLQENKEEYTVFRFALKDKKLVAGSLSKIPMRMYRP